MFEAFAIMAAAVIASSMGLTQAISKVVCKILNCPKCLSFWSVIIYLTLSNEDLIAVAVIAVIMSYLSHWVGLVFSIFTKLYDELWEKLNRLNSQ